MIENLRKYDPMEEQQVNHQSDSNTPSQLSSTVNILDGVSGVFALGGAIASLVTQQVALAAFPVALSVGVHLVNRRQSINALQQHFQAMTLQQNLHIVKIEQKLQTLEEQLGQFKQESWLALETQEQDYTVQINNLSEQIKQLQQQTTDLDQSTQSLDSKQHQLTEVVEELRQLENYSQALRSEPTAAQVYYKRGFSYQRLGDKQGAIEDYSEAIRLDSKYAQAYHSRGILYGELGQRKLAVADLRQASKLYFDQGEIESYQKARDLGKELYDLRDVMETTAPLNSEDTHSGTPQFKAPSSVSVEHLFS
ncbi:Tetratricopeptide TPR_2 repeat protein [Gloeothece citriformis PCC 7424]|uniref:Tetratricopeptide TPR_2 repeat protein n=1 Tax=Gloeothece citriformis (strain PCC 7424) TaxID=65393 RepID=B7KJU1_GLOC7|nr:tetratricopeptide repeat protein [Gloeothece citriformis]ACK69540.1 Tetratricopeptide TPR_2 repeat protein [Gloeothece citriformis PCC 7424]